MHFVELPLRHVAASRLAWRIARKLAARGGWSMTSLSVSRRWRFRVKTTPWIAEVYVSFFFTDGRRSGVVYAIYFGPRASKHAKPPRAVLLAVQSGLPEYTRSGRYDSLMRRLPETKPRLLLEELDRVARAFGADDHHPPPRSRARSPSTRLRAITEAIVAHGTWALETPAMWLPPKERMVVSISPMPSSGHARPELSSMLYVAEAERSESANALIARAEARGYHRELSERDLVLMKLQPLSLQVALAEAKYLEAELARVSRLLRGPS